MTGPLQAYASGALSHAWNSRPYTVSSPRANRDVPIATGDLARVGNTEECSTNCVGRPEGGDRPIDQKRTSAPYRASSVLL
jgi:hypothetical protein